MFWSDSIEMLRALIFGVAHVCNGSIGLAEILVSFAIRLALLPLTLRLARRAREHQDRLRELKPELERLQKRYANDPAALWRETAKFYRVRGVKQVDPAGFWGGLAQMPVLATLYATLRRGLGSAIRFLWIADTSLPNLLLNVSVAGVTAFSVIACQSPETTRSTQLLVGALIGGTTIWFLGSASALFALSAGAGSVVGLVQAVLLRRDASTGSRAPSRVP
jgi:YidC/Oxa1 family membrane protein insertase